MLLPRPLRLPAAALLVVCVAVTVPLAIVFAGHTQPSRLDAAVDPVLRHSLGRVIVLLDVCDVAGLLLPVSLMTLALTAACLVARRWSGAVLALLATPIAAGLAHSVLKPLVHRTIRGYQSFPSGHAAATFALA
jgi:membrane-associated phospholipid phosphatase